MLKVYLRVKFRAFFFTFGTVERTWVTPLPSVLEPFPIPKGKLVDKDERGVVIVVEIV